ncbi:MAG: glycosyltransferase [Clostridia bacterium]|nr:glycosyltransferase [Clostridia bacterium]
MPLYSIVIPVYNSSKMMDELYSRIKAVFDDNLKQPFEMIMVDDCSKDGSFAKMLSLNAADERVKVIQLAKNHGQHRALMCGFEFVSGDFVITMDDDLQHPPEEIPKLIEKMNSSEDIDVVIGAYDSKKHNAIRNLGTLGINAMSNYIFGKRPDLKLTSFRLMKRYVVDALCQITVSKPTIGHLLLDTASRIENTTVEHRSRASGKSGYKFGRLVTDFINNIINNSDFPLKFVGAVGVVSLVVSFLLIVYYLIIFFGRGISVQGWTTLIILVLFFGGMILFSIGILGRYLINILTESKKMPKYIIRCKKL